MERGDGPEAIWGEQVPWGHLSCHPGPLSPHPVRNQEARGLGKSELQGSSLTDTREQGRSPRLGWEAGRRAEDRQQGGLETTAEPGKA